jgi:6-phosphogluconolactonase
MPRRRCAAPPITLFFCPVSKPEIVTCRDVGELAHKAAEQFVALAGAAVARAGRFAVALSGGSTPRAVYSLLGSPEFRDRVDWPRVHLFWGDERCVPPDHPESNFRMVQETLLAKIQIPSQNVHRMIGEKEPAQAAAAYEQELREFFAVQPGQMPRFDLILLGLGEDGHTASLFPGTAALDETEHWVAAVYVEQLQSYRLTLTLPVINAAAQVTFLVSGASKAKIVSDIFAPDSASRNYPAAQVRPMEGRLTWMIDRDAAKELPSRIMNEIGVSE